MIRARSLVMVAGMAVVMSATTGVLAQDGARRAEEAARRAAMEQPRGDRGDRRMMGRGMGGGPGMGGQMPEITSRQFDRYAKMLALTDEQKSAAKELFEGYRNEIRQHDDAMRKQRQEMMEKFRENRDPSVFEGMQAEMTKQRDKREATTKAFMNDFKVILTADQEATWPRVERAQRRDQSMARGRLAGENVDLVHVVDEAQLDADTMKKVAPMIEQYETEVDRELTSRNAVFEDSMTKGREAMRDGDMEKGQELFAKARDASVKVRDVNRRFARQIADALPPEKKGAFELAVKKASFPQVYRDTAASKQLTAAEKIADLSPEQKTSITELKARYEREIATTNDKLAQAIEERQMEANIGQMFRGRDNDEEDPVNDLREKRRELGNTTTASLQKLLNEKQREHLPSADEEEEDDGPGFRRGMGGRRPGGE